MFLVPPGPESGARLPAPGSRSRPGRVGLVPGGAVDGAGRVHPFRGAGTAPQEGPVLERGDAVVLEAELPGCGQPRGTRPTATPSGAAMQIERWAPRVQVFGGEFNPSCQLELMLMARSPGPYFAKALSGFSCNCGW